MECSMRVVPIGCYGSFPKLAWCRFLVCRCCHQPTLSWRVPSSKTPVSKSRSKSFGRERLISREICCWGSGKEGLKTTFERERWTRLLTDIVVCAYGKASEAVWRHDGLPSDLNILRASLGRRSGRAHLLREKSNVSRYADVYDGDGCREVHNDVPFSNWGGKCGIPKLFADDSTSNCPGCRVMIRNFGERRFQSLEDRLQTSCRFSNSLAMQGPAHDREGIIQNRARRRGAGMLKRRGEPGSGRLGNSIARQSSSNVPRSELMKLEELRFSGDMQEGDSGAQVLNLQRALFWLGHLRGLSLTGYFGPETTRALQEFHYAQGIPSPGVWGLHSQHMLWKLLYPEVHERQSVGDISEKSQLEQKKFPDYSLIATWLVMKIASIKAKDKGVRSSQGLQYWHLNVLTELVESVSTRPYPTLVSCRVGVLLLTAVVLASIFIMSHFCFGRVHRQPAAMRVMSWRNAAKLRRSPKKRERAPLTVQQDQPKASEGEKFLQYLQNHLHPKFTDEQWRTGCNLVDHLVLFDGQVVRGDYRTNRKMLQTTGSQLATMNESNVENGSGFFPKGKSPPVSLPGKLCQSGSNKDAQKTFHGRGQFQKIYWPRGFSSHNWSLTRTEMSPSLNGSEQLCSGRDTLGRASYSGWASWLCYCFTPLFANKERLPSSPLKTLSRRAVVRKNSPRQTKSPEQEVATDLGTFPRSSKFVRGIAPTIEKKNWWQEKNEADLKQVEELYRTVKSMEQTRVAAMHALAEQKAHNLELAAKIRHQKEAAAYLEEEVQVLKDSHDALLASLRKPYSSSGAV